MTGFYNRHLTFCSPVVTVCTTTLTFNNSTFCPHTVFMCFVWISEKKQPLFPYTTLTDRFLGILYEVKKKPYMENTSVCPSDCIVATVLNVNGILQRSPSWKSVKKALNSWKLAQYVTLHLEVRWFSVCHQAKALLVWTVRNVRMIMTAFVKPSVSWKSLGILNT